MKFDKNVIVVNIIPNSDTEHFHHPVKIPLCPFKIDQSLMLSPAYSNNSSDFCPWGLALLLILIWLHCGQGPWTL